MCSGTSHRMTPTHVSAIVRHDVHYSVCPPPPFARSQATDRALLFSAVWAIGVSLATEHWAAFDALVRKLVETEKLDVGLPMGGLCFDQYLR